MDYEKNKEALAVVKQMVADGQVAQDVVEKYFPELAESEDEKIRKWLIRTLKSLNSTAVHIDGAYEMMLPAISWLERQKEPMVKLVFPKFRVGDIVRMKEPKGSDWDRRITYIDDCGYNFDYPDHGGGGCIGYAWEDSFELVEKSLKDRVQVLNLTVTDEELAQAKKDAYNDALNKIEYHSGEPTFDDGWNAAIWYLKKKNINFQNTWKPSDEQMNNK